MSEHALSVHSLRDVSWPCEGTGFRGSPNETSAMRAIAPGCGFWRRGGTAWVLHSAIACGHGPISSWKLGWKNGLHATEPTQSICSELDEGRFFGQQRFPRSGRTV